MRRYRTGQEIEKPLNRAPFASVPELTDLSDESPETLAMYGVTPGDGSFASNCLLARRMAERGVRFIQLYHRGWDHHGGITHGATDELGYNAVEDVVTVHDFHATMLHLLGLNHSHLTVKHQGLDKKLTGLEHAHVIKKILA